MQGLRIERSGPVPELYLYSEIGPPLPEWYGEADVVSAKAVLEALDEIGDVPELIVRINSPGGEVFEGVAIYNALVRRDAKIRVEIDALAASIASVIAMAGDEITIAGNALIMIHQAWTITWGNADDLAQAVDSLRKVDQSIVDTYAARVGDKSTKEQIEQWLAAETWMTAEEAVQRGFADRVGPLKGDVTARVPAGRFKNAPEHLVEPPKKGGADSGGDCVKRRHWTDYLPAVSARILEIRRRTAA